MIKLTRNQTIAGSAVVIGVVVVVVALLAMRRRKEGYMRQPLSGDGFMKRTPVDFAFHGDGMTKNPHYQADPNDDLVPLEFGKDFYDQSRGERQDYLQSPHKKDDTFLINDSKTRRDLIDSGEMDWYRVLRDMESGRHVSSSAAVETVDGLYDNPDVPDPSKVHVGN